MRQQPTSTTHAFVRASLATRKRFAALEQLLSQQQQRIAKQEAVIEQQRHEMAGQLQRMMQQEAEVTRLREVLTTRSAPELILPPRSRQASDSVQSGFTSRRTLLRMGGVGVAVGAVAVASGLAPGAQVARAAGGSGDGTTVVQGTANVNTSSTGTILQPVASTSPIALLTSDNSAGGSKDTNSSGVTALGPTNTNGVIGIANGSGGYGVWGNSDAGVGVVGQSTTGIDFGAYGTGRFQQLLQLFTGAPTVGAYSIGEQIRDAAGDVWICTGSGTPGTWARLTSVASGTTGGAIMYLAKPIRLLDTRSGATDALNTPGSPFAGGSTNSLTVAGVSYNGVNVPASLAGAIGNVTVVNPVGGGYLALVPQGAGFTGTAILAFNVGQVVSNSFNVGLSGGQLDIIVSTTTDVILDLFAVVA